MAWTDDIEWKNVKQSVESLKLKHDIKEQRMTEVMKKYFEFLTSDVEMADVFVYNMYKRDINLTNPKISKLIEFDKQLNKEEKIQILDKVSDFYWKKERKEILDKNPDVAKYPW